MNCLLTLRMLAAMLSEISGYVSFNLGNDFKLICGRRVLFIFILLNIFSAIYVFEFLLSTVPKRLKMEKKHKPRRDGEDY